MQKWKSFDWPGCIAVSSAQGHFLFTCYLFALLFLFSRSSDIPRVGPVEAVQAGRPEQSWTPRCCQLLLLYFPKLWSAETGDLILILIGFFWIEMRVEILELLAKENIGSLFLWDYHYNTSFSLQSTRPRSQNRNPSFIIMWWSWGDVGSRSRHFY